MFYGSYKKTNVGSVVLVALVVNFDIANVCCSSCIKDGKESAMWFLMRCPGEAQLKKPY